MPAAMYLFMRRIISLTVLALTLAGGVALADRHRDHRWNEREHRGPVVRHDDRRWENRRIPQREYRRPVYWNNGSYRFHNGYFYNYVRPVIRHRYYDYRYRPQLIV